MEMRRIGSLSVSAVGLGCNNFGGRLDAEATARVVHAALDAGVNFLDTADIYGGTKSEEYIGRALAGRRDDVVLATKFGGKVDESRSGAKADYVLRALEDSLRRLQTDRIDLYQLHLPVPETPIGETLGALAEAVRAGKVREIGCSNFSVAQIREAEEAAGPGAARFVSVQNEYNMLHRAPEEDGVLDECRARHLAFVPYFPLASGLLTGKYTGGGPAPEGARLSSGSARERWVTDRNCRAATALAAFADSRGHALLDLAFSWLLARQEVASVIAGATREEQVRANVAAAGWKLTPEDLAQVDAILRETA